MEVLNYLQVAPTHLHPNGWGFIQTFETFCWAQEWHYSSSLFCVLFQPYRKDKKKEWISLHQNDNPSLFTCYVESFKDWKHSYVKITPRGSVSFWQDDKGRDLFPLYWNESHYSLPQLSEASLFGFLEEEDYSTYRKLCAFFGERNFPIHCKDVVHAKFRDQRKHCLGK
jgi:hypothetical protein